jgi:methionyl-tRNA formyltransferase
MTRQLAIVFAGTPRFAVPALETLLKGPHRVVAVYTQPDRPAGRGRRLTASPVKELALAAGVPVEQPARLRGEAEVRALAGYAPDVMVVVAYGLLLPLSVLEVPALGCVNIHASLLPRWRGAAPIQRAIEAGDLETGVTIMSMDQGLDTGPILDRVVTPIGPHDTAGALHDRLASIGAAELARSLERLAAGTLIPQAQSDEGATYARKIEKEEARLDFARPAVELDRQIRAFNPWPIAETTLRGVQLRIHAAEPVERPSAAAPGTVVAVEAPGMLVATGRDLLALRQVQLAGRRVVTARELAHATSPLGEILGR